MTDDDVGLGFTILVPPLLTSFMQYRGRLVLSKDRRVVTQIWAAAGAGKTTLLALCAEELARTEHVAWVSLTAAASGRPTLPRLVGAALRLARKPEARVWFGPVSADEIRGLDAPLTLIIDDVHLLAGRAEGDWLTDFITRRPETLRVVLAGRYAPASLARVGLLPEVVEIRSADLAFRASEMKAFFLSRSLSLSNSVLAQVYAKTEGWAAALSLVAGWFRNMPDVVELPPEFLDDHRALGDYLVNEVLDLLPEDRRRFLLMTSVVDALTIPLAVHLSGCPNAGEILDSLEHHTALLTHTSHGERHYRYHATLLSYLRAELRRRDVDVLHRAQHAAAEWHRNQGRYDLSLISSLSAGDATDILRLVEIDGVGLVLDGNGPLVHRALERLHSANAESPLTHLLTLLVHAPHLPEDPVVDLHLAAAEVGTKIMSPMLHLVFCALQLLREWGAAREPHGACRDAALRRLDDSVAAAQTAVGDPRADLTADVIRFCAIARAQVLRVSGDVSGALECLRVAAEQSRASSRPWVQLVLLDAAATAAAAAGKYMEALSDQAQMAELAAREPLGGEVVSARAQLAVAAADFAQCREQPMLTLDELLRSDAAFLDPGIAVPGRALQLMIQVDATPGHRQHFEDLDRLLLTRGHGHRRTVAACAYRYISLALQLHDLHRAEEAQELIAATLSHDCLESVLGAGLIAATRGRHSHAESALIAALEKRCRTWHSSTPVFAWLTVAQWADRSGREALADERLLRALEFAERMQLRRPFIALDGVGMDVLEVRLGRLGAYEEFATSIMDAWQRIHPNAGDEYRDRHLVFTPKERDILRELPKHQSVGDIAAKQHLSPNTIKTHLRAIYQKLGVSGRTHAVEEARAHGLL